MSDDAAEGVDSRLPCCLVRVGTVSKQNKIEVRPNRVDDMTALECFSDATNA